MQLFKYLLRLEFIEMSTQKRKHNFRRAAKNKRSYVSFPILNIWLSFLIGHQPVTIMIHYC